MVAKFTIELGQVQSINAGAIDTVNVLQSGEIKLVLLETWLHP